MERGCELVCLRYATVGAPANACRCGRAGSIGSRFRARAAGQGGAVGARPEVARAWANKRE